MAKKTKEVKKVVFEEREVKVNGKVIDREEKTTVVGFNPDVPESKQRWLRQ